MKVTDIIFSVQRYFKNLIMLHMSSKWGKREKYIIIYMQKVKGVYLCCEVTLELENRREYDGNSLLSKFESFKTAWLLNKCSI